MAPVRMCWVWLEVRWRHAMRGRALFRANGEPKQVCISERLLSAGQRLGRTRRAWAEDQLSGLWERFQPFILTASQKPLVQLENLQLFLPLLGHRTNTWGWGKQSRRSDYSVLSTLHVQHSPQAHTKSAWGSKWERHLLRIWAQATSTSHTLPVPSRHGGGFIST